MSNELPNVSRAEIAFLCETLDEIYDKFQISSIYFYGENEDKKVLNKIYEIKSKIGINATKEQGGNNE